MIVKFSVLKNFALAATDGDIGKIKEFYFDDQSWVVRYLVLQTGSWLAGKKVLISPRALGRVEEGRNAVDVHLTRAQVEQSPLIDEDKPVSRQYEEQWHSYYGYPFYWNSTEVMPLPIIPPSIAGTPVDTTEATKMPDEHRDPHLQSSSDVHGFALKTNDGEIGHLDDFLVDDDEWSVRYLAIRTNWWTGRKVILPAAWADRVSVTEEKIVVPLDRDTIKDAPEWNELEPISREFEIDLFGYYGRKGYWTEQHDHVT